MYKEQVIDYCINELQTKPAEAERLFEKISKYPDIYEEFHNWLKTRNYSSTSLTIKGYSASDIHELSPDLTGIGVYSFLVTLRDNPELAQEILDSNFEIL